MRPIVISLLAVIGGSANAQSEVELYELAQGLGMVIGLEEQCSLSYDQAAIDRFVDERVPPEDLGFLGLLSSMITMTEYGVSDWSESELRVQCRAVENSARAFGFIE